MRRYVRPGTTDIAIISTRGVFGDYTDTYDMTQAVEDGATGYDYEKLISGNALEKAISGGINFILGKRVANHGLPENERTRNVYIKEALLLRQALSLCGSLVDERTRFEAVFFEAVRTMIVRLQSGGTDISFPFAPLLLFYHN